MSSVSRLRSGPRMRLGVSASAARTTARLVMDLDPGTVRTACTGPMAAGAGQGVGVTCRQRSRPRPANRPWSARAAENRRPGTTPRPQRTRYGRLVGMCGRYASSVSAADLVFEFDIAETMGDDVVPSWNIAPTDPVRAVVKRRPPGGGEDAPPVRQLRTFRWGLVPSWAKDRRGGARMINARVETVTTKPAFKSAAARRRCLLPALGYYEWCKTDGRTVP